MARPAARSAAAIRTAEAAGNLPSSPLEIPWEGWREILVRTYHAFRKDHMRAVAGGVVFFLLLAIFPTITAFVSLYALFSDAHQIHDELAVAGGILPNDSFELLRGEVARIAATSTGGLGLASVLGILVALWSANAGTKATFEALNVAFDETETRGFFRLNLISLTFTLGAVVFLLVAAAAVIYVPLGFARVGVLNSGERALSFLRWPILFVIAVGGLSLLYRFGPSRENGKWRWISVGSAVAAILWLAGSALFSLYLSHFGDYTATYGSLGSLIGLMMWFWLTMTVILAGAELDAEIGHQLAQ